MALCSFSATGMGFLSHTSEEMIDLKFCTHNYWHKTIKKANFQKLAVLCLRHEVLKFVLSHQSNSLRSEIYPWNSWLKIPKSLFTIKNVLFFLTQNYTPYIFKPFLTERKILCLVFCDLSLER